MSRGIPGCCCPWRVSCGGTHRSSTTISIKGAFAKVRLIAACYSTPTVPLATTHGVNCPAATHRQLALLPSINRCIPNPRIGKFQLLGSATYSGADGEVFRTCTTEPSTPRSISCNKWAGFTASQRSFFPIEPLPQVSDTDAVCVSELRCWKLSSVQSFSDLFVIRSDENGRLFDGYCDAVEQWRLR